MATTPGRSVARVVNGERTLEGAGFVVRRPFPTRQLDHFDPFLLLDEMGPADLGPGEAKGAPDHPHRGFETVTYLHYTLAPGAGTVQPVPNAFNAFAYVFRGHGLVGRERRRATEGQMVLLARDADAVPLAAPADATGPLDLLLVAGVPLGEPVVRYGPFVMNTREEIVQAIEDYQAGRMGQIPADTA